MTHDSQQAAEFLDRDSLTALQRHKLAALLTAIRATNPFYKNKLNNITFNPATDPIDRLPFTTRDEIQRDQLDHPPFGTNLTHPLNQYCRYHQTSASTGAPLRWLDTAESWQWWKDCWAQVYRGAGITLDDRLVFPFSFGPFIGFWSAFESAAGLGNLCLPAGGMSTVARLRYILDNAVTVICCTPTYALRMAEVAAAERIDINNSAVRAIIVAGEPGGNVPATRQRIENAWNARVFDHVGMTEIGAWGFECVQCPGGVHVNEAEFIAEVIDPHTLKPVPDAEPGELVLTNLGRIASPLIRYRTGDQIVRQVRKCACSRHFAWLEGGVRGRLDDMITIRGNNVFPSAIENVIRGIDAVAEFRATISGDSALNQLVIEIEPRTPEQSAGLDKQVAKAIRDQLHFAATVRAVPPGTLPRSEMKSRRVTRSEPRP